MKCSSSFLTLLLVSFSTFTAFGQNAEKTLVKSFNLQGKQAILADLGDNIAIQQWNSDVMRVQMTITLATGTEANLKSLIQSGRYNLTSELTADALKISAPALQHPARINGSETKDNVSFIIFVPSTVTVKSSSEATADQRTSNLHSSL